MTIGVLRPTVSRNSRAADGHERPGFNAFFDGAQKYLIFASNEIFIVTNKQTKEKDAIFMVFSRIQIPLPRDQLRKTAHIVWSDLIGPSIQRTRTTQFKHAHGFYPSVYQSLFEP
ncbi:hypothetical protein BY458DRAFT_487166 [Sporodiniella umbellata]|nr:hypothetical protein BY458DRAFT_487166 [Sporodiniella umbellata]